MKGLAFSQLALEDLEATLEYIACDKPLAALEFVSMLREKCQLLAQFPELGMKRDDLAPGILVFLLSLATVFIIDKLEMSFALNASCTVLEMPARILTFFEIEPGNISFKLDLTGWRLETVQAISDGFLLAKCLSRFLPL